MTLENPDPASILYQLVNSQATSDTDLEQIKQQVQAAGLAAGIPEHIVERVVSRFESERGAEHIAAPRLFVDWGELPRVGHQVRPEFTLLSPSHEKCRPEVHVTIDRELDHDESPMRRVVVEDVGLWSFHVPFRMTSAGMDCRPGQYLVEIDLLFRGVPPGVPQFYRCRIRLNVSAVNAAEGGVLEIDGDGQSMVNLQGYNLKQFSKVVLKGGGDSVINLQETLGLSSESPVTGIERPITTFEYDLKVDTEKQIRLPTITSSIGRRAYLDACGFFFEDGRRTLVVARPRMTFGRSRDNDVVLRVLPRNDENDRHSRSISRTHFIAELTPEGIELRDESNRGMEVNYRVVEGREIITPMYAGDIVHVELGVTGSVAQKFEMQMVLFGPDRCESQESILFWDELYCEMIGGRLSRRQREAGNVGVDCVRYDRVTNLPGEESYVHLFREALIGGSPARSAFVLNENGPEIQARLLHLDRTFWLELLDGRETVCVNGELLVPRQLVPLAPGMELAFGKEVVRFDHPTQLYLD